MKRMMGIMALVALSALAGCNTIEGVGRDISGGAQRVGTLL